MDDRNAVCKQTDQGEVQLCVTRHWARRPIVAYRLVRSESGYHFCGVASSLVSESIFARETQTLGVICGARPIWMALQEGPGVTSCPLGQKE